MDRPLKIVFITEMYSENMGYSENFLPKAVAKLGHEVHVIASTAQIYFSSPSYKKTYEPFIGPNIVAPVVKEIDGYTLHRLPLMPRILLKKVIRMKGLPARLQELRPDIIQVFNIYSLSCYEAAITAEKMGTKFFTESHIHASVFDMHNLRTRLKYRLLGFPAKLRQIDRITERHYPIGKDVAKISTDYFYVSANKITVQSLGVDTSLFFPAATADQRASKIQLRKKWGFTANDIVCIYTGRFTGDKNPQCLAKAIEYLHKQGASHVKGLFVGSGSPGDVNAIASTGGCSVHEFVKVTALPDFYRAADIGVWPRQESMSQLDAAACGLPLILSDKIEVKERVQGNGFLYEENNHRDLAEKILKLADTSERAEMAETGRKKVEQHFSWAAIARKRIKDYESALEGGSLSKPYNNEAI